MVNIILYNMILNYITYTLIIFTLYILQCVISFLPSVCCNHLIVYCLHVYVSTCAEFQCQSNLVAYLSSQPERTISSQSW